MSKKFDFEDQQSEEEFTGEPDPSEDEALDIEAYDDSDPI